VNHHRRKWFRFPLLKETEKFLEANLTAPAPVPEQLTDQDTLVALDGIPAEFRAVVLLVDVEEFAYKEAAEILSIPIGTVMSRLREVAAELSRRLTRIFLTGGGARPVHRPHRHYADDPHGRDLVLFYGYFHGDDESGVGASHQTGWPGLVAKLLQQSGEGETPEVISAVEDESQLVPA
jgi:hypothetical protein